MNFVERVVFAGRFAVGKVFAEVVVVVEVVVKCFLGNESSLKTLLIMS